MSQCQEQVNGIKKQSVIFETGKSTNLCDLCITKFWIQKSLQFWKWIQHFYNECDWNPAEETRI